MAEYGRATNRKSKGKAQKAKVKSEKTPTGAIMHLRGGKPYRIGTRKVNGLLVFDAPHEFPLITNKQVQELLEGD